MSDDRRADRAGLPGHRHRLPRRPPRVRATTPASTRCASMAPILWNVTPNGFWMVTRYDDVREALQTPAVFTNKVVSTLGDPDHHLYLIPQNLDGKAHVDCRHVVNPWFSPGSVKRIEPLARERCIAMIEELRPAGSLRHDGRLRHDVRHRDVPRHPRPAGRGRRLHAAAGGDDLRRLLRRRPGRAGDRRRRDQAVLRAGDRRPRRAARRPRLGLRLVPPPGRRWAASRSAATRS